MSQTELVAYDRAHVALESFADAANEYFRHRGFVLEYVTVGLILATGNVAAAVHALVRMNPDCGTMYKLEATAFLYLLCQDLQLNEPDLGITTEPVIQYAVAENLFPPKEP